LDHDASQLKGSNLGHYNFQNRRCRPGNFSKIKLNHLSGQIHLPDYKYARQPDEVSRQHWSYNMNKLFLRFLNDNSGATAIEYGLIAAGISVAIIAVVNGLGSKLNTTFTSVSTQLK
jgi:pilus assembly protein Flp/PilA